MVYLSLAEVTSTPLLGISTSTPKNTKIKTKQDTPPYHLILKLFIDTVLYDVRLLCHEDDILG